jgi:hypothetical protein
MTSNRWVGGSLQSKMSRTNLSGRHTPQQHSRSARSVTPVLTEDSLTSSPQAGHKGWTPINGNNGLDSLCGSFGAISLSSLTSDDSAAHNPGTTSEGTVPDTDINLLAAIWKDEDLEFTAPNGPF